MERSFNGALTSCVIVRASFGKYSTGSIRHGTCWHSIHSLNIRQPHSPLSTHPSAQMRSCRETRQVKNELPSTAFGFQQTLAATRITSPSTARSCGSLLLPTAEVIEKGSCGCFDQQQKLLDMNLCDRSRKMSSSRPFRIF